MQATGYPAVAVGRARASLRSLVRPPLNGSIVRQPEQNRYTWQKSQSIDELRVQLTVRLATSSAMACRRHSLGLWGVYSRARRDEP